MTKNELAKEVAVSEKMTISTAYKAVDGIIRVIKQQLAEGNDIYIRGFGSLSISHRKEHTAINFITKETITVPAHKTVIFKPGKDLKDLINNND